MPRLVLLLFCVLISIQFCGGPTFAQVGKPPAVVVDRVEAKKWRDDLRYMAEEMPRRHRDLFHSMSREQFDGAVRQLDEKIPSLARHQIIIEMAKIVAMVGDGHTNIYPTRDPKIGFQSLPVKLYLFGDGLFIRGARREHAALVGARVLKIGPASAEEAVARTRQLIGRDNEMDVKFFAPLLLAMPEVLHALGLSDETSGARFVVEKGGRQQAFTLAPVGPAEIMPADTDLSWLSKEGWVDLRDDAPTPLWLKDPQDKFWFQYLQDSRVVYAQLNQVGDKEKETLADFSKRLFAFVEANPVDKLILDLRLNRGGNGTLLRPLVVAAIRSKVNQPGRLFVVMGRSTFSAAQFLLNDLEKYTQTTFVGEPSGSKGNIYGDSRKIILPNSGMTVRVSVYYWQSWMPWDTRPWTAPQLTAEMSSGDYRAGTDPALKAILGYVPRKPLAELLLEATGKGGADLAAKRFREFMAEPFNRYAAIEEPLLVVGQRLLDENKPDQALTLFNLNAESNPDSFRAYFAIGEAYFRLGNKEQAARNLEKALELNPKSYDVAERLRQLKQ